MDHLYLVPGFFGFANFGDLKYFAHVRQYLGRQLPTGWEIHYVPTKPTARLRRRAARLLEVIDRTAEPGARVHVIGHSTGGLDARLLVSPGFALPPESPPVDLWVPRIRTVVGIATPHHGTPLARVFASALGQQLLRLVSAISVHTIRLGSLPLPVVGRLGEALAWAKPGRLEGGVLEQLFRDVVRDFDASRRDALVAFFREMSTDQGLITQLTPEAMDIFNTNVEQAAGVRYGSVVTRARPPAGVAGNGPYLLYRALHQMTCPGPNDELPQPSAGQSEVLRVAYGDDPNQSSNDAIVPTLSQLFGEVVHAVWADHLDVIGHFGDPLCRPPHVDWLPTRTGFRRPEFEALWGNVARFLSRTGPHG